jgi:NAD-dependent DNA ligase
MKDQVILFTGFHPKDLEEAVVREGGKLVDTWSGKITILVVKDADVSNEKTKKAAAAGIPVMTADQFKKRL